MKFAIILQTVAIIILMLIIATTPKPGMAEGDKKVFKYLLATSVAQATHIVNSDKYFAAIGEVVNLDEDIAKDYGEMPIPDEDKNKLCYKQLSILKSLHLERLDKKSSSID